MPRIYKSAQGQLINMDALYLLNEKAQAVGNMKVNSNGDEIDTNGQVVKSRDEKMRQYYQQGQQTHKGKR